MQLIYFGKIKKGIWRKNEKQITVSYPGKDWQPTPEAETDFSFDDTTRKTIAINRPFHAPREDAPVEIIGVPDRGTRQDKPTKEGAAIAIYADGKKEVVFLAVTKTLPEPKLRQVQALMKRLQTLERKHELKASGQYHKDQLTRLDKLRLFVDEQQGGSMAEKCKAAAMWLIKNIDHKDTPERLTELRWRRLRKRIETSRQAKEPAKELKKVLAKLADNIRKTISKK